VVRRTLALLLCVLISIPAALAGDGIPDSVGVAPSGSCSSSDDPQIIRQGKARGTTYCCNPSGQWEVCADSSAPGNPTGSGIGACANADRLSKYSNSTHLGCSTIKDDGTTSFQTSNDEGFLAGKMAFWRSSVGAASGALGGVTYDSSSHRLELRTGQSSSVTRRASWYDFATGNDASLNFSPAEVTLDDSTTYMSTPSTQVYHGLAPRGTIIAAAGAALGGPNLLSDGGVEGWTSTTVLPDWKAGSAIHMPIQETTIVHAGSSSAKLPYEDAVSGKEFRSTRYTGGGSPFLHYLLQVSGSSNTLTLSFWMYGNNSGGGAKKAYWDIQAFTSQTGTTADYSLTNVSGVFTTWGAGSPSLGGTPYVILPNDGVWSKYTYSFPFNPGTAGNSYWLYVQFFNGGSNNSGSDPIYLDDVTLQTSGTAMTAPVTLYGLDLSQLNFQPKVTGTGDALTLSENTGANLVPTIKPSTVSNSTVTVNKVYGATTGVALDTGVNSGTANFPFVAGILMTKPAFGTVAVTAQSEGPLAFDSDADGTGRSCIVEDETSGRLFGDKNCNGTKDGGEEWLDNAGGSLSGGTSGRLPVWTSSSTQSSSWIFDRTGDGTNNDIRIDPDANGTFDYKIIHDADGTCKDGEALRQSNSLGGISCRPLTTTSAQCVPVVGTDGDLDGTTHVCITSPGGVTTVNFDGLPFENLGGGEISGGITLDGPLLPSNDNDIGQYVGIGGQRWSEGHFVGLYGDADPFQAFTLNNLSVPTRRFYCETGAVDASTHCFFEHVAYVGASVFLGNLTGDVTGNVSGNAGTATTLAANGSNCSAGQYPLGVDVSGASESCTDAAATSTSPYAPVYASTVDSGCTSAPVGRNTVLKAWNSTCAAAFTATLQGTNNSGNFVLSTGGFQAPTSSSSQFDAVSLTGKMTTTPGTFGSSVTASGTAYDFDTSNTMSGNLMRWKNNGTAKRIMNAFGDLISSTAHSAGIGSLSSPDGYHYFTGFSNGDSSFEGWGTDGSGAEIQRLELTSHTATGRWKFSSSDISLNDDADGTFAIIKETDGSGLQLDGNGDGTVDATVSSGTVTATTFSGALSGNATTTTALAANGSNCAAGQAPLGVDASGAAESCFAVTTPSSTDTFTNKTLDASGTGNTVTIPWPVRLQVGRCNAGTFAPTDANLPSTNPPAGACIAGTNTIQPVLDYNDDGTTRSSYYQYQIPSDVSLSSVPTFKVSWMTTATSGNMEWCVATTCVANDGTETNDPSFNTADCTGAVAAPGVASKPKLSSITMTNGVTGCSAGELMHIKLTRNPAAGNDTIGATARQLAMVEIVFSRAM